MASTPFNFRLNNDTDKNLIDLLESAGNKSEFMKNALFHYFLHLVKGEVIDRELPLGWGREFSELLSPNTTQKYALDNEEDVEDEVEDDVEEGEDVEDSSYDDNVEFDIEFEDV